MTTEVEFTVYGKTEQELNDAAQKALASFLGKPEETHFAYNLTVEPGELAQLRGVPVSWIGHVSWRMTT